MADIMKLFNTHLVVEMLRKKAVWLVLLMVMFVAVLVIQKSKSSSVDSHDGLAMKANRDKLLSEKDTLHLNWLRTLNPIVSKTEGGLVWNSHLQKGYMRFVNLPLLKGGQYYQLWVYDLQLSTNHPVSAAIFKTRKGRQEWFMEITPEEKLQQPFKFLLTIASDDNKQLNLSQSLLLAQP